MRSMTSAPPCGTIQGCLAVGQLNSCATRTTHFPGSGSARASILVWQRRDGLPEPHRELSLTVLRAVGNGHHRLRPRRVDGLGSDRAGHAGEGAGPSGHLAGERLAVVSGSDRGVEEAALDVE